MNAAGDLSLELPNLPGTVEELISAFWAQGIQIYEFDSECANGIARIRLRVDNLFLACEILHAQEKMAASEPSDLLGLVPALGR